jgi:LPS export ABC transporter permease LptG
LLVPTLALAGLASAAAAVVYLEAVPWANHAYVELFSAARQRTDLNREIEPGRWISEGGAHIHARGLDLSDPAEPWLLDVDVVMGKKGETRREHVRADRARITRVRTGEETSRIELTMVGMTDVIWDSAERKAFRGESRRYTRPLAEGELPGLGKQRRPVAKQARSKTVGELRQSLLDIDEMDRIDALPPERAKEAAALRGDLGTRWIVPQRRARLRTDTVLEIHKKFSIPFACIVFGLCGLPLGIATRRGGRPAAFVVSLGVIALWWVIHAVCVAWVDIGKLSPAIAAWMPDIVIAIVGIFLIVRTRRQQAVGLYRSASSGILLTALILLSLLGVLFVDHALGASGEGPLDLPTWLPAGAFGAALLAVVMRLFRDPISAALARLAAAFRRSPSTEERPGSEDRGEAPVVLSRWRAILERFRGGLVFGLLALGVICVLEALQHPESPVAGMAELLLSWEGPVFLAGLILAALLQHAGIPVIKTMDGWVLGTYLRSLALVLGSMVALYVIVNYVDLADEILEYEPGWDVVGSYYWHMLPLMLFTLLPYATMFAALIVFGVMAKFNETTALRCLGVSLFRVVSPVVLVGAALSVLAFGLHDYVLPGANREADSLRAVIKGQKPRAQFDTRGLIFARDNRTLYLYDQLIVQSERSRTVKAPNFLNLTVIESAPNGKTARILFAKAATWDGSAWVLKAGWKAVFLSEGEVELEPFSELSVARIEAPDYFSASRVDPSEMTFADYREYIADQGSAGYGTAALEMHLQKKLAFPAAAFVLVLVGLPFAFRTGRRGALYGIGVAAMLAVSYYLVQALFAALGDNAQLPPLVAAWAPNLLFGTAGVYLLLGIRT